MGPGEAVLWLVEVAARELTLFAAAGVLLGGIDDLLVDLIWIGRSLWRRYAVFTRFVAADATGLRPPARPGRLAVFIGAWQEEAVIGPMLEGALASFRHGDYAIYVGCYPNDTATRAIVEAIAARDGRVRPVVNARPGPTTKADALNSLWRALQEDERCEGRRIKAVVLHDAEDVVHPEELRVFDTLIERFALVQLPVLPLVDPGSRWVAGTYLDDFAEHHGKTLVVRELLGAGVPSAGTGCAIARPFLAELAAARGGDPFDAESLTEDYELGLRLREGGARGAFVRIPESSMSDRLVAVRAFFPATIETAVRQRARWMVGIALSGWDRLGWSGGLAERWMRLRDRRAILSALVLVAAYGALVLQGAAAAIHYWRNEPPIFLATWMQALLAMTFALLAWRAGMRWLLVRRAYGRSEAWRAMPRLVIGNIIAMLAARRAVVRYMQMRRAGTVTWDKTVHTFPDAPTLQ
jgi:bacteriophage N4 adsorption protein B